MAKKLLTLILISILAFVLTACGTPQSNFVDAINRLDDTDAVSCKFENTATVTIDGTQYDIKFSGTTLVNNDKEQFKVDGTATTTYGDKNVSYTISTTYYDGYLYSSTSGTGYKQEMSYEDASKLLMGYASIHGLDADSFSDITETTENGNYKYTFSLSDSGALKAEGLTDMLARVMSQLGTEGNLTIKKVDGSLALDNTKRPATQDINVEAEMDIATSAITISQTIHTTFEMSGSSFDIGVPDGGADFTVLSNE